MLTCLHLLINTDKGVYDQKTTDIINMREIDTYQLMLCADSVSDYDIGRRLVCLDGRHL